MCKKKNKIGEVKRQPTEWEKILANHISDKGLVSRIYKELLQLNNKKPNKLIKIGQRIWIDISPRKYINGQEAHEKMFSIISHQANANQNHNEIALHSHRMALIKKAGNSKYWKGCGEIGMLVHCWWECKMMQPLWKIVWQFFIG